MMEAQPSTKMIRVLSDGTTTDAPGQLLVNAGGGPQRALPTHQRALDSILSEQSRTSIYETWRAGRQHLLTSKDTSEEEKQALSVQDTTISSEDVLKITNIIEKRLRAKTTFVVSSRIKPFVAGVDAYGKAFQTYANAAPLTMAPLWGTIQVAILIASHVSESFEMFLDMLQDISENLPRFEQYSSLFKDRAMFHAALSLLYSDIGAFLASAIKFFSRRGIIHVWRSLWKPFKEEYGHILDQIKKHIVLVEYEANLSSAAQQQQLQEKTFSALESFVSETLRYQRSTLDAHRSTQDMMAALQLREVTKWLDAVMPQEDFDDAQRLLHPSTGSWLLNLPRFKAWLAAPKNKVLPVLWVHGAPGCGKTILAAKIIQYIFGHMKQQKAEDDKIVLGYFFCDFKDVTKNTRLAVARSLVAQLLAANTDLFPHVVDTMTQSGSTTALSAARLFSLAKDMLATFANSFLVIDGVDECSIEERRLLIESLNEIALSPTVTKVIFLSRKEPDIQRAMISYPSYAINPMDTKSDISQFLADSLSDTSDFNFSIRIPLRSEFQRRLSDRAVGNFLWVRLMLDTLNSEDFETYDEIKDAVTTFPVGLGSAYARVLLRLLQQSPSMQKVTITVLQLMVSAYIPLRLQGLCYSLTLLGAFKPSTVGDEQTVKRLLQKTCGPLIDFPENGTVIFTHQTVSEFLTSSIEVWKAADEQVARFRVDSVQAHETMATCCLCCLQDGFWGDSNGALRPHCDDDALFEYSGRFWADHIAASTPPTARTAQRVEKFLASENAPKWLKWRLQAPGRKLALIGELFILEYKLREWAKTAEKDSTREAVATCVKDLYERWHSNLLKKLPESDPEVIESANILGDILMAKGNYSQAAERYSHTASLATKSLGDIHPLTLDAVEGLANAFANLQFWEKAVDLNRQVMQGRLQSSGEFDRRTLLSYDELAGNLIKSVTTRPGHRDDVDRLVLYEAADLLDRSFTARAKIGMSPDHLDYLTGWRMLSWSQMSLEQYEAAEQSILQHQALAKRVVGTEHRDYHHSMDDLGRIYENLGQYEKAEATYSSVLRQRKLVFGQEHPDVLGSLMFLAKVQRKAGKLEQAIDSLCQMEPLTLKVYGRYPNKPTIMLADIYIETGHDDLARPLLERYINGYKYTNRADEERATKAASDLADLYVRNGLANKAIGLKDRKFGLNNQSLTTVEHPLRRTNGFKSAIMGLIVIGFFLLWRWYG